MDDLNMKVNRASAQKRKWISDPKQDTKRNVIPSHFLTLIWWDNRHQDNINTNETKCCREISHNRDVNNQWISLVYDANVVVLAPVSSVDSRLKHTDGQSDSKMHDEKHTKHTTT